MNTKYRLLTQLLLCLERLSNMHNPNSNYHIKLSNKNVEFYKGLLGIRYTTYNIKLIALYIINKYNIQDIKNKQNYNWFNKSKNISVRITGINLNKKNSPNMMNIQSNNNGVGICLNNKYNNQYSTNKNILTRFYSHTGQSSKNDHTYKNVSLQVSGIQLNNTTQWQTYIFNPIIKSKPGIYTLHTTISTNQVHSFIMGFSNKKKTIIKENYYYYLSPNTQYIWIHLLDMDKSGHYLSLTHNSLKINQNIMSRCTTYDIFNNNFNKKNTPNKIDNNVAMNHNSFYKSGHSPIIINNQPKLHVKVIYHSYEHTIQYYINDTLLCKIPAVIDPTKIYPFIVGNSNYAMKINIDFL